MRVTLEPCWKHPRGCCGCSRCFRAGDTGPAAISRSVSKSPAGHSAATSISCARSAIPSTRPRGAEGGYRLGAGATMPPLLLDDEEAVAVALGLRSAATGGVEGIEEASMRALSKIEQILPPRLGRRVAALQAMIVTTPAPRLHRRRAHALRDRGRVPRSGDAALPLSATMPARRVPASVEPHRARAYGPPLVPGRVGHRTARTGERSASTASNHASLPGRASPRASLPLATSPPTSPGRGLRSAVPRPRPPVRCRRGGCATRAAVYRTGRACRFGELLSRGGEFHPSRASRCIWRCSGSISRSSSPRNSWSTCAGLPTATVAPTG